MTSVESLKEFLRSQRVRWLGHVVKMSKENILAMAMKITVKNKKKKDLGNDGWNLLRKTKQKSYNKNCKKKSKAGNATARNSQPFPAGKTCCAPLGKNG